MLRREDTLSSKTGYVYLSRYYSIKRKRKKQTQTSHHTFSSTENPKLKPIKLTDEDVLLLETIKNEGEKSETKRLITPNRFSASVSLLIHLMVLLFAAFIFIEGKNEIESFVEVDFTRVKHRPGLRRMRFPHTPTIQNTEANAAQQQQFTPNFGTMADIPTGNADYVLPMGNFSSTQDISDDNMGAMGRELSNRIKPLAKAVQPKRLPPQITLVTPKGEIVPQIESLASQMADLNLAPLEIPTASLRGDIVESPKFIHKIVPKYPELAKRAEKEGVVVLEAEISVNGTARDIKVIQKLGYGCEEAAIDALKSSRFLPARRGKEPVAVRIQIPYRFQIED